MKNVIDNFREDPRVQYPNMILYIGCVNAVDLLKKLEEDGIKCLYEIPIAQKQLYNYIYIVNGEVFAFKTNINDYRCSGGAFYLLCSCMVPGERNFYYV